MNRMQIFAAVGVFLVLVVIGAWQFSPRTAVSPSVEEQSQPPISETNNAASLDAKVIPPKTASRPTQHPLPLSGGDIVASWDFKGAYAGNPELTAKAQSEILRLSELLVTATSSEMILSVGVANQYELLGDGKKQYEYLGRAIPAEEMNGLPWHNIGVLMEKLGAYKTARTAYEKSAFVQPEMKFYHYAYIEFLMTRMGDDTEIIEKAFAFAEKNIGQTPYLIQLRADWEQS